MRCLIDDLRPGMRTSADVLAMHGQVLLPAALVLTAEHIAALRRRGVEHIRVVKEDGGPARPPVDRAAVIARLEHLFRHAEQQQRPNELLTLMTAYRLRGSE